MNTRTIVALVIAVGLVIAAGVYAFYPKAEPVVEEPAPVELSGGQKSAIWKAFLAENKCVQAEATTTMAVLKMSEEGRSIEVSEGTDFWWCKGFPMIY